MNAFFRWLAWHHKLINLRFDRDRSTLILRSRIVFREGSAFVSDVGSYFLVCLESPRCKYVRVISTWTNGEAARRSACMLSLRTRREADIQEVQEHA